MTVTRTPTPFRRRREYLRSPLGRSPVRDALGGLRASFLLSSRAGGAGAILDSAIGRWPFDEGSSSTLADSIGTNTGTLSSGTWITGTWIGDAALSNPRIDFDSTYSQIASGNAWSVSITFQTSDTTQSNKTIWQHSLGTGELFAMTIESGEVVVGWYDGSSWNDTKSGSISADAKTRIFWTYSGSSSRLWLNNTEVTNTTQPGGDQTAGMTVGYDTGGARAITGDVDEPIVYDVEEDAGTVDDDYNRQPWS